MAELDYTYRMHPTGSCRGTTNKTDIQTDVKNVPVDTIMDQVKLLILCILKSSWVWYKAMMASQRHHITSDSVYNLLILCSFLDL